MELRGEDNGESLEIQRSSFGEAGTPADEDLLLNITINARGYSAADQSWAVASDWRTFMKELCELERHRQGRATLMGASPDELRLVFEATDHAGHLAVSGFLGWHTSEVSYRKLEFGFAFDGGRLQNLIKELEEVVR
jgi:hypothetical protein